MKKCKICKSAQAGAGPFRAGAFSSLMGTKTDEARFSLLNRALKGRLEKGKKDGKRKEGSFFLSELRI